MYKQTVQTAFCPLQECSTTSCIPLTYAYAFMEGSWEKWEFWAERSEVCKEQHEYVFCCIYEDCRGQHMPAGIIQIASQMHE